MKTTQSPATSVPAPKPEALNLVMIQANPTVGALQKNLEEILAHRRAHADADLIVLSECFLTGYPLQDLVGLPHFISAVARAVNELQTAIRNEPGPAVLFGAPTPGADKPYNSAILIRADGTLAMTHKQELPNNDVFDEMRNFAQGAGKALPLRLNEQWNLGVMVCEDGWHEKVARDLKSEGANILISINGSPAKLGKQQQRLQHMRNRVEETGLPLVYVNQFGGQDELVFDGSSFALNMHGEVIAKLAFMEGDTAELNARPDARGHAHLERPHYAVQAAAPSEIELMYRTGVLGTRDYANKNFRKFIHLGVSGGADSALALAMACDAVGPARVIGYRLPSEYTSDESMKLAEQIIKRVGCKMETVDISGSATAMLQAIAHLPYDSEEARSLAAENVLPRLRMTVLRAAVNLKGGMLLGTSNMSESLVGYTTIDGDMAADYNPLKNLYKEFDVFEAMKWRNLHIPATSLCPIESPIPQAIIDRIPSAENKPGQTDEATLGSYRILDPCLKGMVEQQMDAQTARLQAQRQLDVSIDPTYVVATSDRIYANEFKRRQACIGPQIRQNSLGLARRYPITNQFREPRPA